MALQDYYQILQISPNSTSEEVKKAFRKLALEFHPDIADDKPFAEQKFRQIKEAYEVLSNTQKRQEYHYKRFYKSYPETVVITPEIVLQQAIELAKFTAILNPYRIDFDRLSIQIGQIVPPTTIQLLQQYNRTNINQNIVQNLLQCTQLLPYRLALPLHQNFRQLALENPSLLTFINKQTNHQYRLHLWDKYKLLLALLVTSILCGVFYCLVK